MTEIVFLIAKILGILFILCRFINKYGQVSDPEESINLLSESLSMRTGNFTSQKD